MSITDPNSVLILGAGASKPFGLPLGGELIRQTEKALKDSLQGLQWDQPDWLDAGYRKSAFQSLPILATLASEWAKVDETWERAEKYRQDCAALHQRLQGQTAETIDDFIAQNPRFARLTKVAVSALILRQLYDGSWRIKALEAREVGQVRNWAHLLINIIRHSLVSTDPSKPLLRKNEPIRIISFNYDTILEWILDRQFHNAESMENVNWRSIIDIQHVHGCFDPLERDCADPCAVALSWANNLHVVNEATASDAVNEARRRAGKTISEAREIYAAGFSFASPNCRLLGLKTKDELHKASGLASLPSRRIYFCNWDGNIGVRRSVEKYSLRQDRSDIFEDRGEPGSNTPKLSIVDWIRLGNLGELPG